MLDASKLQHPLIRDCVDALVERRGGLVVYDQGMGGRETLVAASARIAAATGTPLTIIDAEPFRVSTARLIEELGPVEHTFLSPAQAAHWPTGFQPAGVLAIHADVLRDPALLGPLHAAARETARTGHLVIARHSYGSTSLDPHAAQVRQLRVADFLPSPTTPGHSNGPDEPGPLARAAERAAERLASQEQQPLTWPRTPHEAETWIPADPSQRPGRLARQAQQQPTRLRPPTPNTPMATYLSKESLRQLQEFWKTMRPGQEGAAAPGQDRASTPGRADGAEGPATAQADPGAPDSAGVFAEQQTSARDAIAGGGMGSASSPPQMFWVGQPPPADPEFKEWARAFAHEPSVDELTSPPRELSSAERISAEELEELYAALENPDRAAAVRQMAALLTAESEERVREVAARMQASGTTAATADDRAARQHPQGHETAALQPPHHRPGQ
ncbi:hypothetical protein AB0B04_18695 [Streptomyces xinghaiensis]|uniref:Uncharacterized protein n=1 Tax=Streptomyces xinghaiensis TaxID=1038928 RepID=A0A420UY19_9ACTN|nr:MULTISPECIES: hypothetical protein [Streptomyces]OFA48245.1 hypothetical protein BEN35_19075 [Streptomyces fradiae]PQM20687.1 hypothetical protein Sfr7A_26245 [Streptomyces xinghaiensis]RKM92627.1 hypothetical protein SFRA_024895 [Streptomyces xinghaiensis]RNC70595.1 hypothetical protein DC095_025885 [Streptomyces xinghaiensis]